MSQMTYNPVDANIRSSKTSPLSNDDKIKDEVTETLPTMTAIELDDEVNVIVASNRFATPQASPLTSSPKTNTDSLRVERRACRICQSETGEMVRPCACTGTMGDIHERCLNEWIVRSNNHEICEICHQRYSKSGNVLQPIWKWHRPQFEMTNLIELSSVVCLSLCLWYMISLSTEREFIDRVFSKGLPPRSPDIARISKHILITLLILSTLIGGVMNTVMRVWQYINKQRAVRFINSEFQKKAVKV